MLHCSYHGVYNVFCCESLAIYRTWESINGENVKLNFLKASLETCIILWSKYEHVSSWQIDVIVPYKTSRFLTIWFKVKTDTIAITPYYRTWRTLFLSCCAFWLRKIVYRCSILWKDIYSLVNQIIMLHYDNVFDF